MAKGINMNELAPSRLRVVTLALGVLLSLAAHRASAAQKLSLATSTGDTSATITAGATTFELDLVLSTDHSVSAFEYYIDAGGAAVRYGNPVLAVLGAPNPFTIDDLGQLPAPATPVALGDGFEGITGWIESGNNGIDEYPAFTASVARYTFDVSQLTARAEPYVFTPIFLGYAAHDMFFEPTYAAPGTFQLTVQAVPEPTAAGLTCAAFAMASLRRKRQVARP